MLWTEPLVICGFSEVGEEVAASTVASGVLPHRISVIDRDPARLMRAARCGYRTVASVAPFEEVIRSLGGAATSKVVICLADELAAEAVSAVRVVSPNACVQVILETSEVETAVAMAGADLVLSMSRLAGRMLAASAMNEATALGPAGS
jgi:voltage-gated potassium channel Kch